MSNVEEFPAVEYASEDGLLALGGDLSPERLMLAYSKGIFPWYNPGEPILWWSPNPRCVIFPDHYRPSRSTRRSVRKHGFTFSFDHCFENVIRQCASPRQSAPGTWITQDMNTAYTQLHHLGFAHSVETWKDGELVGGLYGIAMGKVFFGESMFSTVSDASKAALAWLIAALAEWGYALVDCQITSDHLLSLGAEEIPRQEFVSILEASGATPGNRGRWEIMES